MHTWHTPTIILSLFQFNQTPLLISMLYFISSLGYLLVIAPVGSIVNRFVSMYIHWAISQWSVKIFVFYAGEQYIFQCLWSVCADVWGSYDCSSILWWIQVGTIVVSMQLAPELVNQQLKMWYKQGCIQGGFMGLCRARLSIHDYRHACFSFPIIAILNFGLPHFLDKMPPPFSSHP